MAAAVATGLAITNPLVKYRALVATRQIIQDPAQLRLAVHLQKLYEDLKDYEPQVEYSKRIDQIARSIDQVHPRDRASSAASTWRAWLGSRQQQESMALTRVLTSHESAMALTSPRGLMLHGEVGTGKSMLVDLFAECLPNRKKRRWHFNTFMLETLARLEALRRSRFRGQSLNPDNDHALLWLAKDMIQESPILFLDEFQMPDRAASKILTNLMTGFFQLGGVLIATSNRMPEELDKAAGLVFPAPDSTYASFRGWQTLLRRQSTNAGRFAGRSEFAAFLEVLKARCDVWQIESGKDYRRLDSDSIKQLELNGGDGIESNAAPTEDVRQDTTPELPLNYRVEVDGSKASDIIESILAANTTGTILTRPIPWTSDAVTVYGRTIQVPRTYAGICYWTFHELCHSILGPADYITLASTYHTVILTEVPVLTWLMKNEARRFITLLDALYESRCRLAILAAAAPDDLFFPDRTSSSASDIDADAVHAETFSEAYQDATAPFRPNILTQNPNYAEPDPTPDYTHARLAGLLAADALEDDPPNRPRRHSSTSSSTSSASGFARSFGRTDAEIDRPPIDPDEPFPLDPVRGRLVASQPLDFGRVGAFTGEDERFAYRRAQSRLWELCGARWWAARRGAPEDWHRPLPATVRRWEGDVAFAASTPLNASSSEVVPGNESQLVDTAAPGAPGAIVPPRPADAVMGVAIEDGTRDARSFKNAASASASSSHSPFRTVDEPPPKFNWTHFWGTTVWGPRAGAWGQGPQGRRDRGHKDGQDG